MTNEEIIKTLRNCGEGSCDDCIKPVATCGALYIAAADAIEDLKQLADNIEKERRCLEEERRCLEEEVHRLGGAECQHSIELACKEVEIEILRGELRRMFRLYVAAETRADTGVNTEELDEE